MQIMPIVDVLVAAFSRKVAVGIICLVAGSTVSAQTSGSPEGPTRASDRVDLFFDEAPLLQASLSPDGKWLARLVSSGSGGVMQLIVGDLHGSSPSKVLAQLSRARIEWFRWVGNDLLILGASETVRRGVAYRSAGLLSVRREDGRMRVLIKTDWDLEYTAAGIPPLDPSHDFLALGSPGTEEIIVGQYLFERDWKTVRKVQPIVLNARSGAHRVMLTDEPPGARRWHFDGLGRARMAFASEAGQSIAYWRDLQSGAWRELYRHDALIRPFSPLAAVGDALYVQTALPGGDGDEIRKLDFASGKPASESILATPGFSNAIQPILDPESGSLRGWTVTVDARTHIWLRPEESAVQGRVDSMLKGRVNQMSCRPLPCDKAEVILVHSYSDRDPGDYLLFLPRTNQWQRVGATRPKIDSAQMASVEFHRIKARDGQEFPVWITRPPVDRGKPKAAVVLVHGGPWVRGREWEWDPMTQYIASLGYVVIEPEFRGSTGYGDKLFRAGFGQWGLAMQDDVTDALRFAVSKGYVDPARVCIAGASYGGYATLMGLAKDPDQYRCGVAWVGVTDIELMFTAFWSDVSNEGKTYGYGRLIGDPVKDKEKFDANSPIKQASRIKAPVFLAYGGLDHRVPIEHGERFRAALRAQGREPEWAYYDNEGHGWYRLETNRDFWPRVETFLAKHLKP
jgi:acetyl esterase/lipase